MELHDKPWGLDLMKLDKALCQRLSTFEDSVTKTLEGLTERLGSLERPQRGEGVTEERMPSGGIRLIVPDPPEDDSGAFLVVARVPSSLMPVCPVCAMTAIQPYDGVLVCGACNRRLAPLEDEEMPKGWKAQADAVCGLCGSPSRLTLTAKPLHNAKGTEVCPACYKDQQPAHATNCKQCYSVYSGLCPTHQAQEARLIDERVCAAEVERQQDYMQPFPNLSPATVREACALLITLAFWLTEEAMRRGKPEGVVAFGRLWLVLLWVRAANDKRGNAPEYRSWPADSSEQEDEYERAILTGNLGEILTHLYG